MVEWFKLAVGFQISPRVQGKLRDCCGDELTFWRALGVYLALLDLNRIGDCKGLLEQHYASPRVILRQIGVDLSEPDLHSLLDCLESAGMVKIPRPGERFQIRLCGWTQAEFGVLSPGAARQRRHRAKAAGEAAEDLGS